MDFACVYVEDMRLVRSILQDMGEVLAVGVGDEDLSEIGTVDQVDDALNTLTIKLVEDVVEEQDGAQRRFTVQRYNKICGYARKIAF